MPKLWEDTIDAHRRSVREATVDAAAALAAEDGPAAITMARLARRTGLGRATLYRHFPDAGSVVSAWHERQLASQLELLSAIRAQGVDPAERLEAVLEAYGQMLFERAATDPPRPARRPAGYPVRQLLRDLLAEGAATGVVRDDVGADELARYCVHALSAASDLSSAAAVSRLVTVTMTGLLPPT